MKIPLTSCLWLMLFLSLIHSLEAIFWSPNVATISPLDSSTDINNQRRSIAIDASGNMVAIWQTCSSSNQINLQSADFPKGDHWSSPLTIASIPAVFTETQIAINSSGYAVVVWTDSNGLKSATRQFGGSWSIQFITTIADSISTPQIAVDSTGNAIAIWLDQDSNLIYSSTLAFGGNHWSSPIPVSPITEIATFQPRIGVDTLGNAVAIWINQSNSLLTVEAATLVFGSTQWSPVTTISNLEVIGSLALAVDVNGFSVAAWIVSREPNFIIQAATLPFIVGGIWNSAQNISNGLDASTPTVAIDSFGNAITVWSENDSTTPNINFIQSAYLPKGSSAWQSPLNVTPPPLLTNPSCACDPAIALDINGNAIAVWHNIPDLSLSPDTVQTATLTKGGSAWSSCTNLSDSSQISDFPQIVIDPTGYAVVSWINETLTQIQATVGIPTPIITNINPNKGPTIGDHSITITGTNFLDVTAIQFGSTRAANFQTISPTTINVIPSPGGSPNTTKQVDVTVTTISGTSVPTINSQYTYQDLPTINDVNPNSGSTIGSHLITITGTNFLNVNAVTFGEINALNFTVLSPTSMRVLVPPGTAGSTVDIKVITPVGISPLTPNDHYTYQQDAHNLPMITYVDPNNGLSEGNNTVIITGTNFINVNTITFGEVNALNFTILSSTSMRVLVPPGTAGSTVDIKVITPVGISPLTPDDHYTYQSSPLLPPKAPSHFIGIIKENKYLNKTEYLLKATWDPSRSSDVVSYRIYKHSKIVKKISVGSSSSSDLVFKKILSSKKSVNKYSITAVNSNGLESRHTKMRIVHE